MFWTHTHTLYIFTWCGPSYKYGMRPNHCDIVRRLDFFWCRYRCLHNVFIARTSAASRRGFQLVNVSASKKKKKSDKAVRERTEPRSPGSLSTAKSKVRKKIANSSLPVGKHFHGLGRLSSPGSTVSSLSLCAPRTFVFNRLVIHWFPQAFQEILGMCLWTVEDSR